jgi:hypothetical protein
MKVKHRGVQRCIWSDGARSRFKEDVTRSRLCPSPALVLAVGALIVALVGTAVGPGLAVAAGEREKYSGPVDLPEREPGVVPHASIEFTIHSGSRRGSHKLVPKLADPLKERNVYYTCDPPYETSSGVHPYVYPTEGNSDVNYVLTYEGREIRVKNRSFSARYTDTYSDGGSRSWSVTGRIPRSGPATGTIRITEQFASGHDCDTGLLTWTASKK